MYAIDDSTTGSHVDLADRSLTDDEFEDLTATEDSPIAVTFSTQDFDVSSLVKRLERGSMVIPNFGIADESVTTAGFQRGFVWSKAQMDRFIESLLLGYPIPGIFLIKQVRDNKLLVLDGQQRLVTLKRFYDGMHNGREFTLEHVGTDFRGLTYKNLDDSLQYKLDDSYITGTIVSSDGTQEVNEAIYKIFERLNAGGTQLTPHEIRVALAAGPLIADLEQLNSNAAWRELYGKRSPRLRDQELILRIIALHLDAARYRRPLKTFLNEFAASHRSSGEDIAGAGQLFVQACEVILAGPGRSALRRAGVGQVNVAQTEAVLTAVMKGISTGSLTRNLDHAIARLEADETFTYVTTRATADNDAVAQRLRLASNMIAG